MARLSVIEDETSFGRATGRRPPGAYFDWAGGLEANARTRRRCDAEVMSKWAGPLAEERFTGSFNNVGAEHDMRTMLEWAEIVTVGADEAEAYAEWLRRRTVAILGMPMVWQQVQAVAAALVDRKELSPRAFRQIRQEVMERMLEARRATR